MSANHAVIVGAGVAGLAAAVALANAGWRITVCERADDLRPVGAGIGLTPNALRAMDSLGIGDTVRRRAAEQTDGGIRWPSGRWMARSNLDFIRRRFGDPVLAVHRSELIELLAAQLPMGAIHTSTTVYSVDAGSSTRPATVLTSDGEQTADLVVAADGIRSVLRASLFPDHPGTTYAGYTSWRMVVPAPVRQIEASETWGRGMRFGIMHLPDGLIHCSATSVAPPRRRYPDEHGELLRRFGRWHAPIPELLVSAAAGEVLHHDIEELAAPLPAHHHGRVALVGDAAHAMTPNLGPACLAVEDGVVLGSLLDGVSFADTPTTLRDYTRSRRPRTVAMTRRSRRIGAAGQWRSPLAVAARDLGIAFGGTLPDAITGRALESVMAWSPPTVADRATTRGAR